MRKIFFISFLIFILDFISKRVMVHFLNYGDSLSVIPHFFSFTLTKNTGVAFSMLDGMGIFIIIMSFVVIYFLIQSIRHHKDNMMEVVGYSMVLGGAVGNLFDRIVYGYVIDFLDFYVFGYDYPIFNIADCFIVIGIIILFIVSFFEKGEER